MFSLPPLAYDYAALEPYIDSETMKIHHDKHHGAYVENLNKVLEGKKEFLNMEVTDLLKKLDKIPKEIRQKVVNNAGGHANHSLFWQIMAPKAGGQPAGSDLAGAIKSTFGDFESFQEKFSQAGLGRFGSGWAWLVVKQRNLEIIDTGNQDSPLSGGLKPILCLDVWEHAYYLKYQNRRADYIKAWWNVVNWDEVAKRFRESI